MWASVAGISLVAVVGVVAPMYGWFIIETMTEMNVAAFSGASVIEKAMPWSGAMLAAAVILLFAKGMSGVFLSRVGENVITGVRTDLYNSVVRKQIGWHDDRMNSAGVITATLASDVQLLNGVASEGKAVQSEAQFALIAGAIGAFVWSWPMALCCLAIMPFFMIAAALTVKAD